VVFGARRKKMKSVLDERKEKMNKTGSCVKMNKKDEDEELEIEEDRKRQRDKRSHCEIMR
jgi:hypothetical protein